MGLDRVYTCVIADDHKIVRTGLRAVLETPDMLQDTNVKVVSEAENGLEAIQEVKRHRPDLLILDVTMPFASGAEILNDLRRWSPETKVVVLSAVTSTGLLASMVDTGVDGLFSKASDNKQLIDALPLILRGARHIQTELVDLMRDAPAPGKLSQRERQALTMVIAGKTNSEIAEIMGISPKTAEKHRAAMMHKLGVRSLSELMAKALEDGLIEQQRLM